MRNLYGEEEAREMLIRWTKAGRQYPSRYRKFRQMFSHCETQNATTASDELEGLGQER